MTTSSLPQNPEYGQTWFNYDTKTMRAYDKNGKWVTYEETNDPVLRKRLRMDVSCSCGFRGTLKDCIVDQENHWVYICPYCCLCGGLEFEKD